jgi:hypothetical protein
MTPGSLRDFRSRHKVLTPADQFREIREGLHPLQELGGAFCFLHSYANSKDWTVRIGPRRQRGG